MTMQTVWVVREANGPFLPEERQLPSPAANEVLIKIVASGFNPLDLKIRAGQAAHAKHPLPAVLGLDMAGTVVEAGSQVSGFHPGDDIYGMVGGVGGLQGTLAEYILADARLISHKPANLSFREAAAMPLVTITAWEGLVDRAGVSRDQTVLIHAGAGGIGHIAVQLARSYGARVFATVSEEKRSIVERFAAIPIDYKSVAVEDYVGTHTDGQGFDIVYDTVGGATLDASFQAVKRYTGRVVSALGWGTHALAPLSFRSATYSGVFTLYPLLTGEGRAHHGEILQKAATLFASGALKPLLSKESFSVNQIDEAFSALANGPTGKIVIEH